MRIIHFSDIHIGAWTQDFSAFLDKRLLGMSNFFLRRQKSIRLDYLKRALSRIKLLAPDMVVCTGDFTCIGSPEEYAAVRETFAFLDNAPFEFIAIPGNHDAYVKRSRSVKAMHETFDFLNGGRLSVRDLPLVLQRKNLKIFVVNGARPTHLFSSAGYISKTASAKLTAEFEKQRAPDERRLLICHFPLKDARGVSLGWRRRLYNADCLASAFSNRQLDIALCGHIHTPFRRDEPNEMIEICAGSLTVYGRMNVLDYSPLSGKFTQYWENVSGSKAAPAEVSDGLLTAGAVD